MLDIMGFAMSIMARYTNIEYNIPYSAELDFLIPLQQEEPAQELPSTEHNHIIQLSIKLYNEILSKNTFYSNVIRNYQKAAQLSQSTNNRYHSSYETNYNKATSYNSNVAPSHADNASVHHHDEHVANIAGDIINRVSNTIINQQIVGNDSTIGNNNSNVSGSMINEIYQRVTKSINISKSIQSHHTVFNSEHSHAHYAVSNDISYITNTTEDVQDYTVIPTAQVKPSVNPIVKGYTTNLSTLVQNIINKSHIINNRTNQSATFNSHQVNHRQIRFNNDTYIQTQIAANTPPQTAHTTVLYTTMGNDSQPVQPGAANVTQNRFITNQAIAHNDIVSNNVRTNLYNTTTVNSVTPPVAPPNTTTVYQTDYNTQAVSSNTVVNNTQIKHTDLNPFQMLNSVKIPPDSPVNAPTKAERVSSNPQQPQVTHTDTVNYIDKTTVAKQNYNSQLNTFNTQVYNRLISSNAQDNQPSSLIYNSSITVNAAKFGENIAFQPIHTHSRVITLSPSPPMTLYSKGGKPVQASGAAQANYSVGPRLIHLPEQSPKSDERIVTAVKRMEKAVTTEETIEIVNREIKKLESQLEEKSEQTISNSSTNVEPKATEIEQLISVDKLADKVYKALESRLRSERMRRGTLH